MRFKRTAVAPQGRNKYGDYLSSSNVTKKVIKTSYYGDASNNEIDGGGSGSGRTGGTEDDGNWILDLSLKAYDFDGSMLPMTTSTKTIDVIGYRKRSRADTFIGDISTTATSETYSISGIPETGMTISVDDNGTPQTKINITISSGISETEGVLQIPVSLYLKSIPGEPLDNDISAWNSSSADCVTQIFEFGWRVVKFSNSVYTLDLTNEAATVNCGPGPDYHVLTGATKPTCQAILYDGETRVSSGVTFTLTTPQAQHVQGVTINPTSGELDFTGSTPQFDFEGLDVELTVTAAYNGYYFSKIMTVSKAVPGENGESAVSYWLVMGANAVKLSNGIATPNPVTASAMMQVGEEPPTAATGVSIYYGFNTTAATTSYPDSGVTVDVTKDYISFVLKKGTAIVDGVETVPIISNGTSGASGESVYRLDLTNENASINCDSDGNILTGAVRPSCTAKLYYGQTPVPSGVEYRITSASCSYSGVSISASTGVITFNPGTDSTPFWFNTGYTAIEFTIQAFISNQLYGTAIMTVSRSIAGSDGDSAVSYWLDMSADAVHVTSGGTFSPSTITVTARKQVGEEAPTVATEATVYYGYDTTSPSTTYSSPFQTSAGSEYITVKLYVNGVSRDTETIPIVRDGAKGASGETRTGPAIRGPFNWYNRAERTGTKWCNGSGALGTEESKWIDIILKDGVYYVCTVTYTEAGQSWDVVKPGGSDPKWASAGQTYDFVATNILLANNAKISAFTGNDIYIMNSSGLITAGIQGDGNTFCWAGDENPSGASFKVDYDGTIHASKGEFSGYVRVPYVNYTGLTTTTTTLNGSTISGKDASDYCYIMKVSGSTSDKLILPEPTESLAGMTYRIIVGSYMELYIKGADGTAKHFNIARTSKDIKKIIARYGYIELTCMLAPFGTRGSAVWSWAVTAFNGNLELYYVAITTQGSQVLFDKAINPVYGMSLVTGDTYTVNYINADNPLPSDANKSSDTIYISRT